MYNFNDTLPCFYVIKYTTTPTLNPTYIAHNLVRLLGAQFFMFSMRRVSHIQEMIQQNIV